MQSMQNFEAIIDGEHDLAEVLHAVRKEALNMGIIRQGYFFTPAFHEPNSPRTAIINAGFPEGWVREYRESNFLAIDPIAARTIERGTLTYWADAVAASINEPGVDKFADAMRRHQLEHGFAVPLFGPNGRAAIAAFDFGVPKSETDPNLVMRIRTMSQIAHQRICLLVEKERDLPRLSARESEVLRWIARGKSNGDIATILNISSETVRTYSQRINMKLNTSDRTSAAVKGFKLGLLRQFEP